ncbi:MAG: HEAT repeat domain-containing protein [Planctomycetes bacterium]|nr:HEAT repeat domain-containing protein [Planctomycetota bacterium]
MTTLPEGAVAHLLTVAARQSQNPEASRANDIKRDIGRVLALIGPAAVPELLMRLHDQNLAVAEVATVALAQIRPLPEHAVDAVVRMLQSADPQRRIIAARAVGRIGTDAMDAVPLLIGLLSDEEAMVRTSATMALGSFGPAAKDAVPQLIKFVAEDPRNFYAITTLGAIGPAAKDAVPHILKILEI